MNVNGSSKGNNAGTITAVVLVPLIVVIIIVIGKSILLSPFSFIIAVLLLQTPFPAVVVYMKIFKNKIKSKAKAEFMESELIEIEKQRNT